MLAGHERWKQHFPGMTRILHRLDLMTKTRVMEERLDEKGPWYLVEHGKESRAAGYVTGLTGTIPSYIQHITCAGEKK